MTKNLRYFCAIALIASIAFFYKLDDSLRNEVYIHIWKYALTFGLLLFISGFLLGSRDPVRKSRNDLGFQYHLVTFIIVNIIGISWIILTLGINKQSLLYIFFQCGPWGLGLILHYYFSSKSIKGMSKESLFD